MRHKLSPADIQRLQLQAVVNDIKAAIDTYELARNGAIDRKDWALADVYQERLGLYESRLLSLQLHQESLA